MEAYTSFARVYDELMDNIPYDEWAAYILELLKEYNITNGLVAELGCGTGNITERLASAGYDMIGIDISSDMLEIANEKKTQNGLEDILYLQQDMREFELYGTVAAIVCVCDSLNYVLDTEEITDIFRLANNYLEADGLFICDFNTRHYYRDIVADSTIAEDRDDVSFIWDNYYDEEADINELSLSLFIREGEENLYRKYQETHYQAGLTIDEVKACVEDSGMELVAMYDAFTHNPADDNSERVYVIAREKRHAGKSYV
jgi:SAM-dependent methyltransferase